MNQNPPPHFLSPQISKECEVNSDISHSPIQYIDNPFVLPRPGDNKNKGKWQSPVGCHIQGNGLGGTSSSSCDTADNNTSDSKIAYKANNQIQQQCQDNHHQEQQQLFNNNDEQVAPALTLSVEERARIHLKPTPVQYQQQEQLILQLQQRQQKMSINHLDIEGQEQQQQNHHLSPIPLASSIPLSLRPSPLIFTPPFFGTGISPQLFDTSVDDVDGDFNDQRDNVGKYYHDFEVKYPVPCYNDEIKIQM
jgi:hypothetical protein